MPIGSDADAARLAVQSAAAQLGTVTASYGSGAVASSHAFLARAQKLEIRWRYYRAEQYEGWQYDWNGQPNRGMEASALLARSQEVPQGFEDAGSLVPLKFRAPSAPYHLVRVIVARFSSLLFSASRHPKIASDDPRTEDWLAGFATATRLWARMLQARHYGGAVGSVAVSFSFASGAPLVEVHDPRFTIPTLDRVTGELEQLEKRYQFSEWGRDADGEPIERKFWYRRLITKSHDVIWPKVAAVEDEDEDGDREPDWHAAEHIAAAHGFGFVPGCWIQNIPVEDQEDGDSDCVGAYELTCRIDGQLSQADRATLANCDPTIHVGSDQEFAVIEKGSGKAIQTEPGGQVKYVEMTGSGVDRALKLAELFEEKVLTLTRCHLDRNEGGPSRTASEVESNYSSMLEQADVLREQYGEAVRALLGLVLRAARQMEQPRPIRREDGTTAIVRQAIKLPKKRVESAEGFSYEPRELGAGEEIDLVWPPYQSPTPASVTAKVDATVRAKDAGLIDARTATRHIAVDFEVENVEAVMRQAREEQPREPGPGAIPLPGMPRFGEGQR